ncbi:hypothetical protein OBBRIDRAFT_211861 [Obba rivulosa]|uniref:Uncharacterized protein n=1 Tax=Obba rivulosa TaxID=1052685 RepID=A0A8E2DG37_9APHY|nr:hypothetical protein OBBRIDRAFT_211861 [Obba rivulosa]
MLPYNDTVRPKTLYVHNFNQYYIKCRLSRSADNKNAERFAEGVTTTDSDDFTDIFMDRVETTLLCHMEELGMSWLHEFGRVECMYICNDVDPLRTSRREYPICVCDILNRTQSWGLWSLPPPQS